MLDSSVVRGVLQPSCDKTDAFQSPPPSPLTYANSRSCSACVCAAYRKVCLEHHPDKKLTQSEDEEEKTRVEEYFKLVSYKYSCCLQGLCDCESA